MFYSQKMTEVEVIVPEGEVLSVTRTLAQQGVFHQVDAAGYVSAETGFRPAESWRDNSSAYAALERRILAVMKALELEEGSPPPADQVPMIEADEALIVVEQLEYEAQGLTEEMAKEQSALEQTQSYIRQLEPIVDIDVDMGVLSDARHIFAILGLMPARNLERLQTSLARVPFVLLTLRQEGQQAVVLLLGVQHDADVLERAARSAYLNPLRLPATYRGTPAQIVDLLGSDVQQMQQYMAQRRGEITELHEIRKEELQRLLWRVRASRTLTDAIARTARLGHTYFIAGWVPVVRLRELTQALGKTCDGIFIETTQSSRHDKGKSVPVAMHNPGFLRAFQQLVALYGQPRYEEIDPTTLIALTFPLLFGVMFGDVGHSLLLVLLGALLASRKIRALRGLADLGTVIVACGVAAAVFGFLYGSLFGMENVLPSHWLRPLDSIMQILMAAVGIGVGLLSLGFLLAIINAFVVRDWGAMLFGHNGISGMILYWSLVGLVAEIFSNRTPVPPWVLAVLAAGAGIAVMFSEVLGHMVQGQRPIVHGSIGAYLAQVAFEMIDTLISMLSNTLSFVRVGAFAVAHGGLSAVVFSLAEMAGPAGGIGYYTVVILGNLFIAGFEGLIVGIQSLRLEYYESFSRFFSGGGLRYTPLTLLPEATK
jgi:V/A-type H+-transporting ATPase subunit I